MKSKETNVFDAFCAVTQFLWIIPFLSAKKTPSKKKEVGKHNLSFPLFN